jgi:hypothetical protein
MDQQNPLPKFSKPASALKIALIVVSAIIVVLAALLADSVLNLNCPLGLITGQENSYEAGWLAASQKLEESGFLRPEPNEIFTISGTVTQISGKQIILKADQTVINPLAAQAPESRTVTVTSQTKIIKQTPKTPEQLSAGDEKFRNEMEKLEPGATPPSPPLPYVEEEIKSSDLKIGDRISVTSSVDIKFATTIEAVQINVTPTVAEPTPPAVPPQP